MKRKVEQAVCYNDEIAVETAIYAYVAAKKLKTEQNGQVYDFSGEGLQNALNSAAENGCYEVFLRLLKAKAMGDIAAGIDLSTPLFKAAEKGHLALIEHILMLWNHSKIIRSEEIHLACHLACREGHFNLVKWFFANKPINVNHEATFDGNKTTMFLSAIIGRHYPLAFYLLEHPNLDPTLLECAALVESYEQLFDQYNGGEVDLVEAILNHPKIDPTFADQYPFRVACSLNFSKTVACYLQEPKINPLLETAFYEDIHLCGDWLEATENAELDPVKEMLPHDPRIHANISTWNSLHQVCRIGSFQTAIVLLEHTKINPSFDNNLLLQLACFKGHTHVISFLLEDPRVIQNLNLNLCMELSIQDKTKRIDFFETILHHPKIEAMMVAEPALFSTLIHNLLSKTEDPYENVHNLMDILLEKMRNLEASQAINPKEAISQEIWIALFNTSISIHSQTNYRWIHKFIELEALNKIEFYTENLKNVINNRERVAFCMEKASHLIPQPAIFEAFHSCLQNYKTDVAKVLQPALTQVPDANLIIETLNNFPSGYTTLRFNNYAQIITPLLPAANKEKHRELLSLAWEKNSPHLVHFLLHHYGLNPATDNFAPIVLVYTLGSNSLNGSNTDSVNFEKAKKLLQQLCTHPAVNTELLLQSQEENAEFRPFLEKVLRDKPGYRVRSLLLEKYKLLTLFGACDPNPREENCRLLHSHAVKNYFS